MIDKLKTFINGATWFLRSGISPVNASKKTKKRLEDLNHMTSKKFAMTMTAVGVIAFMYFISVIFLFFFPADPHVTALVSMYKDMIFAVATIVGTLVGIQGFVDWKRNSDDYTSLESQSIVEDKNEQITEERYLSGPKEDDYTTDLL